MRLVITTALLMSVSAASAAPLPNALVDPYLQIQSALAEDRIDAIAELATSVEQAASVLGRDAEKLAERAKVLAQAKDIAAARTAFGEVSRELEAYAEKTQSTFGSDVRLAYCPMADKSWRQKGKEIRNPYYGAAMLTCGNFKD